MSLPAAGRELRDLETHQYPHAVPVKGKAGCIHILQLVNGLGGGAGHIGLDLCLCAERSGHPIKRAGLHRDVPSAAMVVVATCILAC